MYIAKHKPRIGPMYFKYFTGIKKNLASSSMLENKKPHIENAQKIGHGEF